MKLTLKRIIFNDNETIGELYVDGIFQCYTLEDVVRPLNEKIYASTAIGYGEYKVIISWSPRFRRRLPLLLNVPNFSGVRIHSGNTHKDTEGCILVGTTKGKESIGQSRVAFTALFNKMDKATEPIVLTIE